MHPRPLIANAVRLLTACVLVAVLSGAHAVAMLAPLAKTASWVPELSASGRFGDAPTAEHESIRGGDAWSYESAPCWTAWLSRDPIGEAGGLNLYGYVGNNPIKYIDPQGLTWGYVDPSLWKMLNNMAEKDNTVKKQMDKLKKSNHCFNLRRADDKSNPKPGKANAAYENKWGAMKPGEGSGATVYVDPDNAAQTVHDGTFEPDVALAHELTHAVQEDDGLLSENTDGNGVNLNEVEACQRQNAYDQIKRGKDADPRMSYDGRALSTPYPPSQK